MSMPQAGMPDERDGDDTLAEQVAELLERFEAGELMDLSRLTAAHPEHADALRRVIPTIQRMALFGRSVGRERKTSRARERLHSDPHLGTLGDFRLLREVGRGGMGIVYEAEQISLRRRVALKILPLAAALDPRHHQRFLLEARAAACLHHTHIVPVHAVGSERGVPYYAMQFIDGCTFAEVLTQLRGDGNGATTLSSPMQSVSPNTVPPAAAPLTEAGSGLTPSFGASNRDHRYIRAVAGHIRVAAEALDHAHSRGVLHRDIKPANLMLDGEGHLWITDFGLAQIQGDSRLTLTGDVLGTLRYMSPEQALGRRVVIDVRTDVYSLGATLYDLLALKPVFDGVDRAEVLCKIAQDEPTPLRKVNPFVPRDLETIVHKALMKEPAERYATARDLADDLGRFLEARAIAARLPGSLERFGKWTRRNRAVAASAALFIVLSLIAISGGLVWSNEWLRRHNAELRIEHERAVEFGMRLKDQRDLAERHRRIADRHLYAFRIRQASEALRAGQFEKAQEILRDCRPASGGSDPREFTWNYLWREARKDLAVLSEPTEHVELLALSPDGRTLATCDRGGTIRLRDPETGRVARTLRAGPDFNPAYITFSPNGRWLAVGSVWFPPSLRSKVLIWNVDSGRILARLEALSGRGLLNLAFDAQSENLWEVSADGTKLRLGCWDVKSDPAHPRLTWSRIAEDPRLRSPGNEAMNAIEATGPGFRIRDLEAAMHGGWNGSIEREYILPVAGSRDGQLLATAAGPWTILLDTKTERERDRFGNPLAQAQYSLGFSPDGRYLAIEFTPSDWCMVHDLRDGTVHTIPPILTDPGISRSLAFSPDGRYFARRVHTQGNPQPTTVWQLDPWLKIADSTGLLTDADPLVFARDSRSLIVQTQGAAVRWSFQSQVDPSQPEGHSDEAWALAFSEDGRLLATGSDDTDDPLTLKIWDATTGGLLHGWKAHESTTSAVAFQPGGSILATAGLIEGKNLRLWNAATGNLIATLDGHTDRVRSVAFSPDGRLLVSAGSDRTIRLWDVDSRRCLRTLTGHSDTIRQVAFAPDGRTIASVSNDLTVRLWKTDGAQPVLKWVWEGVVKIASVAFSSDGETLAWIQEDGVIQRWDLARMQLLAPLHSEYDELRSLAFSPDDRTLAVAGKSGTICLWEPVSGQELLRIEGRPCQANSLAFSPDGATLAACWHDGTVRFIRSH